MDVVCGRGEADDLCGWSCKYESDWCTHATKKFVVDKYQVLGQSGCSTST
jgi:hypothetical protein